MTPHKEKTTITFGPRDFSPENIGEHRTLSTIVPPPQALMQDTFMSAELTRMAKEALEKEGKSLEAVKAQAIADYEAAKKNKECTQ